MPLTWTWYRFSDFDSAALYAYLKLRQDVFVVEQNCVYGDLDDLDQPSWHLLGRDAAGQVQAALRLVPPGLKYDTPSLGRVVVAAAARKGGTGSALVAEGLAQSGRLYPGLGNRIGAQAHLQRFYGALGFVTVSAQYDEDGIPHVDMDWLPAP
ncbi:GNAT family N-acetyltransferase [Silvimonas sp. JCM 19000]